jgi:hypothetical protein
MLSQKDKLCQTRLLQSEAFRPPSLLALEFKENSRLENRVAPPKKVDMVNCWPRAPVAIGASIVWLAAAGFCIEVGGRLTWENIGPQAARIQARDAFLLQKLEFRRSGGQEEVFLPSFDAFKPVID